MFSPFIVVCSGTEMPCRCIYMVQAPRHFTQNSMEASMVEGMFMWWSCVCGLLWFFGTSHILRLLNEKVPLKSWETLSEGIPFVSFRGRGGGGLSFTGAPFIIVCTQNSVLFKFRIVRASVLCSAIIQFAVWVYLRVLRLWWWLTHTDRERVAYNVFANFYILGLAKSNTHNAPHLCIVLWSQQERVSERVHSYEYGARMHISRYVDV